jgi:hypothetical protein
VFVGTQTVDAVSPAVPARDISATLLRQIAKDVGLSIEDLLAGQASQQPNTALQPSARESMAPKKPPEPGPG